MNIIIQRIERYNEIKRFFNAIIFYINFAYKVFDILYKFTLSLILN